MIQRCAITAEDHQQRARRRLPRFLADYVDGGAGQEQSLRANDLAWQPLRLRQRVLVDVQAIELGTQLLGQACAMPVALAPIGLAGMMARRGEVQAARAASQAGVPFCLSTVGVCGVQEVAAASQTPPWFQLYMLRDRGVVEALMQQAQAAACEHLILTVDLPMPGHRHRDARNGIGQPGLRPKWLKLIDVLSRPAWVWEVALRGQPLNLGNLLEHVAAASDPSAFQAWVDQQFDPSVTWADIDWVRQRWPGRLLLKGILDPADAKAALRAGVDGLVVSNHGGRQLDGVAGTASCLPAVVAAVDGALPVLVDGGVRSGHEVFKALALGADGVLIGRPWVWALASGGQAALSAWLQEVEKGLRLAMALTGTTRIADIGAHCLDATSSRG